MGSSALTEAQHASLSARVAGQRVVVVLPDLTRPWSPADLLPSLSAALASASEVSFVVGLGLHRGLREAERAQYPVAELHEAGGEHGDRVAASSDVGGLSTPLAAVFDRRVVEADLRIVVSVVEPHQYAGFSGGAKGIVIGCAAAETIDVLHGLELLRDPKTRVANMDGNPFAAALRRLAAVLGPCWGLMQVPGRTDSLLGELPDVHERAVELAQSSLLDRHSRQYQFLHSRVPSSKAGSFYQACRAATYVSEVEASILAPGGTIVVEADCPEGLGLGAGEQTFARALARGVDCLLEELAGRRRPPEDTGGGAQRAYVLARCMKRHRIVRVGRRPMPELEAFGIEDHRSFRLPDNCLSVDPFVCLPVLEE